MARRHVDNKEKALRAGNGVLKKPRGVFVNGPLSGRENKVKKGHSWWDEDAYNLERIARNGLVEGVATESELVRLAWHDFCSKHGLPAGEYMELEFKRSANS